MATNDIKQRLFGNLIDESQKWCIVTFTDSTGNHVFFSCVNQMSGCRLSGFDKSAPTINDSLSWVRSVVRDIHEKADNVKVQGNLQYT